MTVSASLSNALSGLRASAKSAEIVSANISNALTEGYGRREVNLSAANVGGVSMGVRVDGVSRHVDQRAMTDRRLAEASVGAASAEARNLERLENVIGLPDEVGSLSSRIAALESRLIESASRPDVEPRLASSVDAAKDLAQTFNDISDEIQAGRLEADGKIASQVELLNTTLGQIAELNHDIRVQSGAGRDAAALMDQRQGLVDRIADIVPLKTVERNFNQIGLITTGGAVLLDGKPAVLEFTAANTIVPEMSVGAGSLSGLTINDQPVQTAGATSVIRGGALFANFAIRDEGAHAAQTRLDGLARNVIERFESPTVDPTLGPGNPGLFTDNGAAFSAATEIGLAGRMSINALVDPDQGGAVWRLRDGLGAPTPGNIGEASLLQSLHGALTEKNVPATGGFSGAARSLGGLAADFLSGVGRDRQKAQADMVFSETKRDGLKAQELQAGVDSDHELQRLLVIERAYAANARVVQTIDEMIQTLTRI